MSSLTATGLGNTSMSSASSAAAAAAAAAAYGGYCHSLLQAASTGSAHHHPSSSYSNVDWGSTGTNPSSANAHLSGAGSGGPNSFGQQMTPSTVAGMSHGATPGGNSSHLSPFAATSQAGGFSPFGGPEKTLNAQFQQSLSGGSWN